MVEKPLSYTGPSQTVAELSSERGLLAAIGSSFTLWIEAHGLRQRATRTREVDPAEEGRRDPYPTGSRRRTRARAEARSGARTGAGSRAGS